MEVFVIHMRSPEQISNETNDSPKTGTITSAKVRSKWGARVEQALAGRNQAWLARAASISKTSLSEIIKKAMPSADTAVRLAQALDVSVEWLITGTSPANKARQFDDPNWLMAPRFTLKQLASPVRGDPIETVRLHRDWLTPDARSAAGLYVSDLPVALPDGSAAAGDMILCHDATRHDREGGYLYFFREMALIRRYEGPSLDAVREGHPIFDWQAVDNPEMRLVARILGTLKLRSI